MTSKLRPIWMQVQNLGAAGRGVAGEPERHARRQGVRARAARRAEVQRAGTGVFEDSYATNRINAAYSPIINGVWAFAMVATAWFGAEIRSTTWQRQGDLAVFMLYLAMVLQMPVRSLGWIITITVARAGTSGQRIFEILDAESAVQEKPDAVELAGVKGHVRFDDVSFGYDAISPVLNTISTSTRRRGEVMALLGPTGSGKTTVVNLMPRFYDVTGGAITIDGVDIRDVTLASLRRDDRHRAAGCVPVLGDDPGKHRLRRVERHARGCGARRRAAYIHDFIAGLPDGYDTWVGRARHHALGRPEAAHRDRADASADPNTGIRRLDVERGHGDGVPDQQALAEADGEPDDVRDRAAAPHREVGRRDPGPAGRRDRRARAARGAARNARVRTARSTTWSCATGKKRSSRRDRLAQIDADGAVAVTASVARQCELAIVVGAQPAAPELGDRAVRVRGCARPGSVT